MNLFNILVTIFYLVSNPPNIDTVLDFDLSKFSGKWHQVYDNNYNKIFIKNGDCINHYYQEDHNTLFHLTYNDLNSNNTKSSISGNIKEVNVNNPGKLKISADKFLNSDYWISKVGPVILDKNEHAIITASLGLSLFVLVRNLDTFSDLYKDEILDFLNSSCKDDKVYDYLTNPILVNNTNCF